ncbi:MAG TPA: palindromic element RPE2 domain-containing protein [Rickettsia endosymbiont of Sericostoma sp. HW-2014]|nr:palindromic element RPE2 domain-containing protein [Rickettsia endosymbiont of Sericostoma sp. HW-2014]
MVNSGEVDARSDGVTPISNRRVTSDDVTNFSSIDYRYMVFLTQILKSLKCNIRIILCF